MADRPILFSGALIKAILDGNKTETRRLVNPQPLIAAYTHREGERIDVSMERRPCPYGVPGDRLWVREAHALVHGQVWSGLPCIEEPDVENPRWAYYRQGFDRAPPSRWRPSIHMPRWASRITLEVLETRPEHLHEITSGGALAEGVDSPLKGEQEGPEGYRLPAQVAEFAFLWDRINGKREGAAWRFNPWVWVVRFRVASVLGVERV